MGKNTIGGKKHKRAKNSNCDFKRPLQERQEGESYARVEKLLGNSRLSCECFDFVNGQFIKKMRVGVIRGSMRKRVWIKIDDIILISLRGYQDEKCDVIWKYNIDEVHELKSKKKLPIRIGSTIENVEFSNKDDLQNISENDEEDDSDIKINEDKKNNDLDEDLDNI